MDLNNPAILTPIIAVLCQNFCNLKLMRINKTWYNLIRQYIIQIGKKSKSDIFWQITDITTRYFYLGVLHFAFIVYRISRDCDYRIHKLPNGVMHGKYVRISYNSNSGNSWTEIKILGKDTFY